MAPETPLRRRADAERNIARILDRAARLLAEDRGAGMVEIAQAAEVGRATLYRHFPTREVLIDAIHRRAFEEAERAVAESRLGEGTATAALERLLHALIEVGDRYRIISNMPRSDADDSRRPREEHLAQPLFALVDRGRREGDFRDDLSERWLLAVFAAVLQAAIRDVGEGQLTHEEAVRSCVASLLDGMRART